MELEWFPEKQGVEPLGSKKRAMRTLSPKARSRLTFIMFLFLSSSQYVIRRIKNIIKSLIGKRTYLTPSDVFFNNYFYPLLRRKVKITSLGIAGEGPASQALILMNAIAFARTNGLDYVHTPFRELAHNDRPMKEWVIAWENQFNFGLGEDRADEDDHQVDFANTFYWSRLDLLQNKFDNLASELRNKYYSNKTITSHDELRICVHVRRGDVDISNHPCMWTDLLNVMNTLSEVRIKLISHKLHFSICVFSQGELSDFSLLEPLGCQFFLNADPIWTMQELIEADILIMAKSTFSYVAALLSDGIKLYEPCPYPPLREWLIRDKDGYFARDALEQQLKILFDDRASPLSRM